MEIYLVAEKCGEERILSFISVLGIRVTARFLPMLEWKYVHDKENGSFESQLQSLSNLP